MPASPTSDDDAVDPLIRKAERRIGTSAIAHLDLAYLIALWRDGRDKLSRDNFRKLQCNYSNPATPTQAAMADSTQKLVVSEVLSPDGSVSEEAFANVVSILAVAEPNLEVPRLSDVDLQPVLAR